jgi:hypothetical protein
MYKKKYSLAYISFACASLLLALQVQAGTIEFDDVINGATSYLFDANSDGISDVNFSTTDEQGFNTFGPGTNQLFVSEPGLEGTTGLTPDLRIDLLNGGTESISFGFATTTTFPGVVQIFNAGHEEIGSSVFVGEFFDLGAEVINPLIGLQLLDQNTGSLIDIFQFINPEIGQFINPETGQFINPATGQSTDLFQLSLEYQLVNPITEELVNIAQFIDPVTGGIIDPATGQLIDLLQLIDPESGQFFSGTSGFPENFVDVSFEGVAAYVTLDFDAEGAEGAEGAGRYIIDNFTYTEASDVTLDIFQGSDPEFPILPDAFDPENPEFAFELEIIEDGLGTLFPIFIDPIIAVGYSYAVTGPNVETILIPTALPNGDAEFTAMINGVGYDLFAGVTFDIEAETGIVGGVNYFEILDIDTNEGVDPNDILAFNTGLTFSSAGSVGVIQTPITFDTDPQAVPPQAVPEPSTLFLLMAGFGGLLVKRKKRT